jgi:hypothetical protein
VIFRRVLADVEMTKDFLERATLGDVVVGTEGIQKCGLAEPRRA